MLLKQVHYNFVHMKKIIKLVNFFLRHLFQFLVVFGDRGDVCPQIQNGCYIIGSYDANKILKN